MYTWQTFTVDGHDGWVTARVYRTKEARDRDMLLAIEEIKNDNPEYYEQVARETKWWDQADPLDKLRLLDNEESFHDADDDVIFEEDREDRQDVPR